MEEEELKKSQNGKISKEQKKDLNQKYKLAEEKLKTACLVYVPNEGEDDYTLGEEEEEEETPDLPINDKPHIEQPRDDEDGQSEKKKLPDKVFEIRSRMGGRDGPLFTLACGKLQVQGATKTAEEVTKAEEELKILGDEVDKYCDENKIDRATYALSKTQFDAFCSMVQSAEASFILIEKNPSDIKA
ncbi:hypothetical protein VE02_06907 [Pseudogymnoascus sp. 03VT05]|nr:hypothetical protein VE02_06907 [Pseudogymnoascus sp. 03VT05]